MATKEQNDATFAELAAKHGADRIRRVDTFAGMLVFQAPGRPEWKRALKIGILDPKGPDFGDAIEVLSRSTVVHPSAEAYDALIDRYPALPLKATGAILELAGIRGDEEGKG